MEVEQPIKPKRSLFSKILFIKLKAVNPERFVERTYKVAKIFYTSQAMWVYFLMVLTAAGITFFNWGDMVYQASMFLVPQVIPLIWITIFFVTLLHELSHTYSCRLNGGKVTDMGFLLLYFQPCFYSNVSDAYMFPDRKKRIAVTSAGIISQIVVWAIAVLVWRLTALDTLVNAIAFIIIALSFVGITFNLNPLLKLDGYYFLVDYLEIPNLRQKAFRYLRQRIVGRVDDEVPIQASSREKKIFFRYGILSLIYSGSLIAYIIYRVGLITERLLGSLGLAFLALVVLYFILDALNKSLIFRAIYNQRGAILKPSRLITFGVILVIVIVLLLFVHAPLKITNDCVIMPLEQAKLTSNSTGYAELLIQKANEENIIKQYQLVGQDFSVLSISPQLKIGDLVKPGDLIASINSNIYESEKVERLANLQRSKKQLDLLEKGPQPEEIKQTEDVISQARIKLNKSNIDLNRAESLLTKGAIAEEQMEEKQTTNRVLKSELDFYEKQLILLKRGARPEEIAMAHAEVDQLQARVSHLESQIEQTIILSPTYGIVTQINNADTIIAIARTDSFKVRIFVPEKEISAIAIGNETKVKVRSYPGITYEGAVTRIDPQVFHIAGDKEVLWVNAVIPNLDDLIKPGMTGKAKINCGKLPLYRLLLWRLIRILRIEFWSWW